MSDRVKSIAATAGLVVVVCAFLVLIAWAFAQQSKRIDGIAQVGCTGHGGVRDLRGGPKNVNGTGVSTGGNVVMTTSRVDAPYFLSCNDGAVGTFWSDDDSVVVR